MANEIQIATIEKMINSVLEGMEGYFLVNIRIKPTNNVKVFLDGDNGITIETCIKINRQLNKLIEETQLFPADDYSLEVSSPGVGEPLLKHRQFVKNIDRFVEVKMLDSTIKEGVLKEATEDGIVIETTTGKGKKAETKAESILFEHIKSTSVQIKF